MCTRVSHLPKLVNPVLSGASYVSIVRSPDSKQTLWIFGELSDQDIKPVGSANNLADYIMSMVTKKFYDVFLELEYNFKFEVTPRLQLNPSQALLLSNMLKSSQHYARIQYTDVSDVGIISFERNTFQPLAKKLIERSSDIKNELKAARARVETFFESQKSVLYYFDLESSNRIDMAIAQMDIRFRNDEKLVQMYNNIKNTLLNSVVSANSFVDAVNNYLSNFEASRLYQSFNKIVDYLDIYSNVVVVYTLARIFQWIDPRINQPIVNGIFCGSLNHAKLINNFLLESGYVQLYGSQMSQGLSNDSNYVSVPVNPLIFYRDIH